MQSRHALAKHAKNYIIADNLAILHALNTLYDKVASMVNVGKMAYFSGKFR